MGRLHPLLSFTVKKISSILHRGRTLHCLSPHDGARLAASLSRSPPTPLGGSPSHKSCMNYVTHLWRQWNILLVYDVIIRKPILNSKHFSYINNKHLLVNLKTGKLIRTWKWKLSEEDVKIFYHKSHFKIWEMINL